MRLCIFYDIIAHPNQYHRFADTECFKKLSIQSCIATVVVFLIEQQSKHFVGELAQTNWEKDLYVAV